MWEVSVMVGEEAIKISALRVFSSRNPVTNQYHVNFMEDDGGKGVRLFCQDREEADVLTQKIRRGEITDLTGYPAEWNL